MTTETAQRFVLGVALGLIRAHKCPCDRGQLTEDQEYPAWGRCATCGCLWQVGSYPVGERADRVRGQNCAAFTEARR